MSKETLVRLVLLLGVWLSLSVSGAQAANILFISSMDPTHMPGDDALKACMESMGHTVTYFDDNEDEAATEAAAAEADLVFISESVSSGNIRNEITEMETPMIITEAWAWDEMGLTFGGGAGQNVVTTDLQIVAPEHPLAAGLSGTVTVLTALTSARGAARFGNGIAGDEATVIARAALADGQTYDVLYVYDKGVALPVAPADGSAPVAAGVRICLGFDEQSYLVWNENAYALLKAAVNYGLANIRDAGLASEPEPADGTIGVAIPLFQWRPGRGAVLHNIYIGKTADLGPADLAASLQPNPVYWHLPGLEPGVQYCWRVDEVQDDGVTVRTGSVWHFTMQALTAYCPDPADGANDAAPVPTLLWWPGVGATKHHLYFSESADAVRQATADADKGELTETTFAPGDLQGARTCWWRVDEILADGAIQTGPVWSFTTYVPIDDFESYNDEEDQGTRIYETWIDGWTNDNGCTVGYTEPPFAEQQLVHGGQQSMPLDYNNVVAPFYSEAVREFSSAQDWTIDDVNTLVLFVRGKPNNGATPFYVALEDTSGHRAVVDYPDPAIITGTKWTQWQIPLPDFAGVNLARVKRIYLGLGNRDDPTPGGTGRLYIDDLRLTRPAPVPSPGMPDS